MVKRESLIRKGESGKWVEAWHVKGLITSPQAENKADSTEDDALAFLEAAGPVAPSPIAGNSPERSRPVVPSPEVALVV